MAINSAEALEKNKFAHQLEKANRGDAQAQYSVAQKYAKGQGTDKNEKKAVEYYQLAANQKHDKALCNLGFMFARGRGGLKKDLTKAYELFQEAASLGNVPAKHNVHYMHSSFWLDIDHLGLGDAKEVFSVFQAAVNEGRIEFQTLVAVMYLNGQGVERNKQKAIELLQDAAQKGRIEALNTLGTLYEDGMAVPRDLKKAAECFQSAAEKGSPIAKHALGKMYEEGRGGFTKDGRKAFMLFEQAAKAGSHVALASLGYLYKQGHGVRKDLRKAVELFNQALAQGDLDAERALGLMYLEGEGMVQDLNKGLQLLHSASDKGNALAQYRLALMYRDGKVVPKNPKIALDLLMRAAKQKRPEALHQLGCWYSEGRHGVSKDQKKSAEFFQQAADLGLAQAQLELARQFAFGLGVTKDQKRAVELYQLAADQGHPKAIFALGISYASGLGVMKDERRALLLFERAVTAGVSEAAPYVQRMRALVVIDDMLLQEARLLQEADGLDIDAQYNLAVSLLKNQRREDTLRAYALYIRATAGGHPIAKQRLNELVDQMDQTKILKGKK